jgi:transcriptional regulator with XRE-family HTH domain
MAKIGDYVRLARRVRGRTQAEFASECNLSLRTFKRFEAGKSDSLVALVKIVLVLERISALGLLFPDPDPKTAKPRDAVAALEAVRRKVGK